MAAVEKLTYTDPSMAILDYFSKLSGTKNTKSTSGGGTDPKFLEGLQQVLGQQLGQITPEGAQALIGEIFKVGSRQAPVLATQLAQATGARTGNNSPLAGANTDLQAKLASQATQLIGSLQQQASQTAAELARNAPKSSTTETSTAKSANPAIQLAPFLLGQAGNIKKLLGNGKSFADDLMGTGGGVSASNIGSTGVFDGPSLSQPSIDLSSNLGPGATEALDLGSMANLGDLGSLGDIAMPDFSNWGSGMDFGNLDLGQFLADGGTVKKSPVKAYADGGRIQADTSVADPGSTAETGVGDFILPAVSGLIATQEQQVGGAANIEANSSPDFSTQKLGQDVIDFFSKNNTINVAGDAFYTDASGQQYQGYDESGATGGATDAGEHTAKVTSVRRREPSKNYELSFNADDGSFNDVVLNRPDPNGISDFLSFATAAIGLATANPALAFAKTLGAKAGGSILGDMLSGGKYKPHTYGGKSNWDMRQAANYRAAPEYGMANGGRVRGPGTGTTDDVTIKASAGERVVSTDVVDALGDDFFDTLQDLFHTPVGAK